MHCVKIRQFPSHPCPVSSFSFISKLVLKEKAIIKLRKNLDLTVRKIVENKQ